MTAEAKDRIRAIIRAFGDTEMAADLIAAVAAEDIGAAFEARMAQADAFRAQARDRKRRQRERETMSRDSHSDSHSDSPVTGGVGGGLSSGSLPESGSDPDPIRSSKQIRSGKVNIMGADFLAFWALYPRKVGKGAAAKAWTSQRPDLDAVKVTLSWQVVSPDWTKDGGAFIPHPATYLNQRRWEDEKRAPVKVAHTAAGSKLQDASAYLDERDRCSFHREPQSADRPSSDPVPWCRRCKRLGSRPRRETGVTEPMPLWAEGGEP